MYNRGLIGGTGTQHSRCGKGGSIKMETNECVRRYLKISDSDVTGCV
jgi:hypothetical protein